MFVAKHWFNLVASLSLWLVLLTACTGSAETPPTDQGAGIPPLVATPLPPLGEAGSSIIADAPPSGPTNEAVIDTVEVLILESFPTQVNALVKGKPG